MNRFTTPTWVHRHSSGWRDADRLDDVRLDLIRQKLQRFRPEQPEISIVIPAYNEERLILRTLSSLADSRTNRPTEILVANNRSTDRTQELLDRVEVRSVYVPTPGVAYARQAGLEAARGTLVLNADSDCLYPPAWIEAMTEPLRHSAVACVYGTYSFLPGDGASGTSSRLTLGAYEWFSERAARARRADREFVNVLGYNFGFRRADALAVGGFNLRAGHQGGTAAAGACEDGWMAMSLMKLGRLHQVTASEARVWTSARRLQADGSLAHAFWKRARRELTRRVPFLRPQLS
jgi:glycosyltransferase involved in cell wall biosynthesis